MLGEVSQLWLLAGRMVGRQTGGAEGCRAPFASAGIQESVRGKLHLVRSLGRSLGRSYSGQLGWEEQRRFHCGLLWWLQIERYPVSWVAR